MSAEMLPAALLKRKAVVYVPWSMYASPLKHRCKRTWRVSAGNTI